MPSNQLLIALGVVLFVLVIVLPILVSMVLRTVDAGTIRIVTWLKGSTKTYKGPCKCVEVPLLSTSATLSSKAINIDLDIADQTADIDKNGQPRPIKVRVLASAIVSVGDSDEMIRTAANRFFSMPPTVQTSTLTDLLTSTGRRAINLLHHDELFNAKPTTGDGSLAIVRPTTPIEDDDRLAIIIKSACSRELQDLGLAFNSLNIKSVQSDVADARRRQSAAEAKANADIVQADQERRAREAQLGAEQAVNDKQRDLEQRRAENAAVIAQAEAKKQAALQELREAELKATQIAQSRADAEKMEVQATAQANAEAIKLRTVALAQAEAIREINQAIAEGGDAYLQLKQLEMLPQIAPAIANALAQAKLINISGDPGRGAAGSATDHITQVIQTGLAAQLVNSSMGNNQSAPALPAASASTVPMPTSTPSPEVTKVERPVKPPQILK